MEIVEFTPEHATAFRTLNEAWIAKYFAIEAKDREVLGDPQGKIIAKGGRIFMAIKDGEPVGCVAMIRMADGGYEVAKMTVMETLRGSGLGRLLMQRCIDAGAEARAPRLYLETNSTYAGAGPLSGDGLCGRGEPQPQRLRPRRHLDGAALLAVAGEDDAEQYGRPVGGRGSHHMAVPDGAGELQALVHIEDHAG